MSSISNVRLLSIITACEVVINQIIQKIAASLGMNLLSIKLSHKQFWLQSSHKGLLVKTIEEDGE